MAQQIACYTPNGREVRTTDDGRLEVQPPHDNYWCQFNTVEECLSWYASFLDETPATHYDAEMVAKVGKMIGKAIAADTVADPDIPMQWTGLDDQDIEVIPAGMPLLAVAAVAKSEYELAIRSAR